MTGPRSLQLDFRALFESVPGLYLVLEPDAPQYTIVAVSDAYARQTLTKREEIVGGGVFEVFPDNPDDPHTTAEQNTSASFARVIATRAPDATPAQRHDIRRPPEQGGGFEERWWSSINSPVFGPDGEIAYIIHCVDDVTALNRLWYESREAVREKEQRLRKRPQPEIWADRDRCIQVFENLIGNAIKFTPPGGRITVSAVPGDGEVHFSVADTGAGIAPENLPHVFDRFWQAKRTKVDGAGLGLPICKGIVKANGGHIWVESNPGRGTTFHIGVDGLGVLYNFLMSNK